MKRDKVSAHPLGAARTAASPGLQVLAIVPAFNEEGSIAEVVTEIRQSCDARVLVVSDGSTDETPLLAARAGATVARLPFNLGIGGAVQTGFIYALENGYKLAVQVDGDGQHPPAEIPAVLRPVETGECDICVGSRYLTKNSYRAPLLRRLGMFILARWTSTLARQNLTDTTSGFRAFGERAIKLFASFYPHDYPEVESLVLARKAGLRIAEVPVTMRGRSSGLSSINLPKSVYYMLKVTMAAFLWKLR